MKGINKKFTVKLVNNTGSTKNVALLHGTFNVLGITQVEDGTSGVTSSIAPHYHDKTEMAKMFSVDAIMDDGVIDATEDDLVVTAADSKFTVRHFNEYVKTNTEILKQLTIQASDKSHYEKQITVAKSSPLKKNGEDTINLTDYFGTDQFQDKKIEIKDIPLEICDDTVMIMPIDDGVTVTLTFVFED